MIITLATRRLQHFILTLHISSQLLTNALRQEAEADFAHSQFLLLGFNSSIQFDRNSNSMVGQQHYIAWGISKENRFCNDDKKV